MNIRNILIISLFLIFVVLSGCISQDNSKIESLEKEVHDLKNQIENIEKRQIDPLPASTDIASVNVTNENNEINKTDEIGETNVTADYSYETDEINETSIIQQYLYVSSEMMTPRYWGEGRYELTNFQVKIINQQNSPVSIKSQIISDHQVLEEESFTLRKAASNYVFYNKKQYFINNTDVILRLHIQSYKPIDYKFKIVSNFN